MAAASVLNKSVANKSVLNKATLNKNKNKNKNNKNKNKSTMDGASLGMSQLIPAFELRRLHQQPSRNAFTAARRFTWEILDIPPPPGPDYTRLEAAVLLSMQRRDRERARRMPDIQAEATISVSEFTRALYIEDIGGYEQTEGLFQAILTACEYVGLLYKSQFNRLRPNQFESLLRPLLPVPVHESYPSNHAFQCFSIVFAFSTILPEHPATDELARIAQNVAENREWAGLHYPSDTQAGRDLARRFAPYLHDAFGPLFQAVHDEWV
nr:phosphatase PAP2 family protein [Neorhizobium tomejilense]